MEKTREVDMQTRLSGQHLQTVLLDRVSAAADEVALHEATKSALRRQTESV